MELSHLSSCTILWPFDKLTSHAVYYCLYCLALATCKVKGGTLRFCFVVITHHNIITCVGEESDTTKARSCAI